MEKLLLVVFFAISLQSAAAYAEDECDKNAKSHIELDVCLGNRLKKLDEQLNTIYKSALAAMPEQDETDNRKARLQLRQSQRAWLTYTHEQCTLEGGLEGGSNSWVSTFAATCKEREYTTRIKFLQSIADGSTKN